MNTMRPSEQASYSRIEQEKRGERNIKTGVNLATSAALTAGGAALASKVVPFLSEHIPSYLAVKGINKISPKIGKWLEKGIEKGLPVEEGLEFLKEKLTGKSNKKKAVNLIGQISPDLQDFIEGEIQGGKSADYAAATAMIKPEFLDIARGIEKQTKKRFTELVRELYEGEAIQQEEQNNDDLQSQQMQPQAQPQQAPQTSQNQISPRLQQALQRLGKLSGG